MKPAEDRPFYPRHVRAYGKKSRNNSDTPNRKQENVRYVFPFYGFIQLSGQAEFGYRCQPPFMYAHVYGENQGAGSSHNNVKNRAAFPPDKREREKRCHENIDYYFGSFATHQPSPLAYGSQGNSHLSTARTALPLPHGCFFRVD